MAKDISCRVREVITSLGHHVSAGKVLAGEAPSKGLICASCSRAVYVRGEGERAGNIAHYPSKVHERAVPRGELHRRTQKLISQGAKFYMPSFDAAHAGGLVSLSEAVIEPRYTYPDTDGGRDHWFYPDVVGKVQGLGFVVEVHSKNATKEGGTKARSHLGYPCLEIHVGELIDMSWTDETILARISDPSAATWLDCPIAALQDGAGFRMRVERRVCGGYVCKFEGVPPREIKALMRRCGAGTRCGQFIIGEHRRDMLLGEVVRLGGCLAQGAVHTGDYGRSDQLDLF